MQALSCLDEGATEKAVQFALSDRHVKLLNLGADWLRHLLPHSLRKVSRVHFGLLYKLESELSRSRR